MHSPCFSDLGAIPPPHRGEATSLELLFTPCRRALGIMLRASELGLFVFSSPSIKVASLSSPHPSKEPRDAEGLAQSHSCR